jgi:hypothetical protein
VQVVIRLCPGYAHKIVFSQERVLGAFVDADTYLSNMISAILYQLALPAVFFFDVFTEYLIVRHNDIRVFNANALVELEIFSDVPRPLLPLPLKAPKFNIIFFLEKSLTSGKINVPDVPSISILSAMKTEMMMDTTSYIMLCAPFALKGR